MTDTWDGVLVVGAGPVGLTAACQLARLGVPVRVVEVLEHPTTESRAVAVQARSLEIFASMGMLERLEARGRRIGALEVADGRTGKARMSLGFTDLVSRHSYLLDVAQPDTEAVLAERAAELGVAVERGTELVALDQDADGVEVTLRSPAGERNERVGWVVGADGGHSTTRHLVDSPLQGGFKGQHFAMADVDVDSSFPPDRVCMFTHPDGMGMLFPLAGARARVMFLVDPPPAGEDQPRLERMQAITYQRTGGQVTICNPRWLTYFEVHHAQVARYRHGRVFLAGDAAHIHSPAAGQGMNTGIQDATNLAWKLALVIRGRADAGLLDTYDEERHPVGADVVRFTTTLTDVGTGSGSAAALRNAGLFLVGHVRPAEEVAATHVAELAVQYRKSPLSADYRRDHHRGAAQAGDRAPDPVGLPRGNGTPVAVEELLARPGLLVLARSRVPEVAAELREVLGRSGTVVRVVDGSGDAAGDDECVLDLGGVFAAAYGLDSGGMAVIRPDGYLGALADSSDPALLHRYLGETLRVTAPTVVQNR